MYHTNSILVDEFEKLLQDVRLHVGDVDLAAVVLVRVLEHLAENTRAESKSKL